MPKALLSALFLAAAVLSLAGCTTSGRDLAASATAAPGKFMLYNCPDLVHRQNQIYTRQRELDEVVAKANKGAGGAFVSVIAYEGEVASLRGEMRVLRQEAAAKNCTLPAPALLPTYQPIVSGRPVPTPATRPATRPQ